MNVTPGGSTVIGRTACVIPSAASVILSAASVILSAAKDLLLLSLVAACAETAPARRVASAVETVASPSASATVGTSAGAWSVRVLDAAGQPMPGVIVTFSPSLGAARASPPVDTTGADGRAATTLVVGTVPAQNQLSATVAGVASVKSIAVTGTAGPVARVVIIPGPLRFSATRMTAGVTAQTMDAYGNATGPNVTWASRNAGLVSVTPQLGNNAAVSVVSRPGQAYLVASSGAFSDSVTVSVLDATSSPCAFAAAPVTLGVGDTTGFSPSGFACVRADVAGAEYAIITHYSAGASNALLNAELIGTGVTAPAAPWPATVSAGALVGDPGPQFEVGLRARERLELPGRVEGARAWYDRERGTRLLASLREGDHTAVNVNASDFCVRPDLRSMRVAAITSTTVILADNGNPAGGFTDEEYRAFGATMDTLVYPLDTAAFGAPTDIDGNGRIVIAFTRAVNELTPRSSTSGIALGFFFSRDLLAKRSAAGACDGSNVAEMFYILVPDPAGVASDPRSKSFVASIVVSTIAHELQHLINTSRRLYVNRTAALAEESWLNEGLSHMAEELLFYRASGLSPRQNIGAAQLAAGSPTRALFDVYLRGNFSRYQAYQRAPELNSPISTDDLLATRGAAWAFLRYVADRAGPADGTLWRRLAGGQRTGLANLDAQLEGTGLTAVGLLRDWAVSLFTDDAIAGGNPPFQPSWNFVSGMPAVGIAFGLAPLPLPNDLISATAIRAGGSNYVRFGVPMNREALVQFRGMGGTAPPAGARLTVVRTR